MASYFLRWIRGAMALALGLAAVAQAQTPPGVDAQMAALYDNAQVWLNQRVADMGSLPLRMEIEVGELDHRLKLAACERVEPYLPPGTQLWGKTRLGLRCAQGVSKWNVFLPITIKAFGPAWVIKGQVAAGTSLTPGDALQVEEVDWADSRSPVVARQDDWVGQSATRQLSTGQVVRQDMLRAAQVFQSGALVRVLARGVGFEIATSGQAISGGVMGQSARVRMDNGRILSGLVIDRQTVRVEL